MGIVEARVWVSDKYKLHKYIKEQDLLVSVLFVFQVLNAGLQVE